ncbi:Putative phage tail protein, partial [Faunimonas pinastri]
FHLDPLWADDNIDFVGIDNYMPLADWRDGEDHRDWQPMRRISDRDYLQSNIEGGEGFDWYYASSADRDAQNRAAITDGGAGKPWVFRFKDIRSWWSNPHYDRPGGVENGTATAWVPQSKPIWFTELGCPAADKGPNQPNVFVDPKSSESAFPYYSNGWRDDLAQRAFLEAQLSYWDASAGHNPVSSVYGGPMLDTDRICIWTWDARPFPFYPSSSDFWRDTPNWTYGHWLNGRAGLAPLDLVIADILSRQDFTRFDTDELAGLVTGYVLDDAPSARDAIEALGTAFFFDGVESEGQIVFRRRDRPSVVSYAEDDLAVTASDSSDGTVAAAFQLTRAQETDLPLSVRLSYTDAASDYRSANAYGRRLSSQSARVTSTSVPFVMEQADAIGLAEAMLIEAYVKREAGTLSLPPSALALEPGDVADFTLGGRDWRLRVSTISDAAQRDLEAERTDRSVYQLKPGALRDYGPTGGGA